MIQSPLTSVPHGVPYEELGRLALNTALEGSNPTDHIVLAAHVVIRNSVAPPRTVEKRQSTLRVDDLQLTG